MPRPCLLHLAATAALLLSTGCGGADRGGGSIAGSYNTQVSVVSSSAGCSLPVENNPTVVQLSANGSVVLLRHAGTTYGGALRPDRTFVTEAKTVVANGIDYVIVVSGRFSESSLDATVTLDYGAAPACHVVVRWLGPKRR